MEDSYTNSNNLNGYGKNMDDYSQAQGILRNRAPQYSMPGILQFLQTEWSKMEMERSQWEVERAELQARIAFLQGERKGQENLKQDLVRRIKMLEFALKQERAKNLTLKYGTEPPPIMDIKPTSDEDGFDPSEELAQSAQRIAADSAKWKEDRQKLRQYLQEVGYADTIVEVRQTRVKQLLGLTGTEADQEALPGGDKRGGKRRSGGRGMDAGESLMDAEAAALGSFDFLGGGEGDEEEMTMGEDAGGAGDGGLSQKKKAKKAFLNSNEGMAGLDDLGNDPDTDEALAEFDFLVSQQGEGVTGGVGEGGGEARSHPEDVLLMRAGAVSDFSEGSPTEEWAAVDQQLITKLKEQYRQERKGGSKRTNAPATMGGLSGGEEEEETGHQPGMRPPPDLDDTELKLVAEEEGFNAALGLGDLARLTVANESEGAVSTAQDGVDSAAATSAALRRTWNAKYTLRSHFDAIRAVAFHPVDPVLLTASEDHTLKLWNLSKTVQAKKSASLDVEPVYTFRGHTGPVLSLAVHPSLDEAYSGGTDGIVRVWRLPNSALLDPYDAFDPTVHGPVLQGHTDSVWSLACVPGGSLLLSGSSDGSVCLWQPTDPTPLRNTYRFPEEPGLPTSVACICGETTRFVVGTTAASAYLVDAETGSRIVKFEPIQGKTDGVSSQINCVVTHPSLPMTITAHEDRQIRFYDNNSGKLVHSMVAHLDAVTSLAVDPNGLYLLSGSHDCSIRLWNLDNKTCVQEITSHRKKFEESINNVAFHPSKHYLASAGADALAKVFV